MASNFMYKRVNIFLLILMCLIVIGLAGSAVYFQESFKDLSKRYESVKGNYSSCRTLLADKNKRLDACVEELNSTAQDVGKYDKLYQQKVQELKETKSELKSTNTELQQTLVEKRSAEQQLKKMKRRRDELKTRVQQQEQRILDLRGEIDDLRRRLNSCQEELSNQGSN